MACDYELLKELGRGGMAVVFLALDRVHDRHVAVKMLRAELASAVSHERFLREMRLTARLQHPAIVALFDSGLVDDVPYYVMPYIEGESLRSRLDRQGQMAFADTLRIAIAIGGALTVVVADSAALGTAASLLQRMTGADPVTDPDHRQVSVAVASDAVTLAGVAVELSQAGVEAEDVALRRPTLDDVFLRLTGSSLDDAGSPGDGDSPGDNYPAQAETAGTAA